MTGFTDYLPEEEARKLVKEGVLYKGVLRVNPMRRKVAYISSDAIPGVDICIPDEVLRNRAIHGDTVVVELLPSSQWIERELEESGPSLKHIRSESEERLHGELWQPQHYVAPEKSAIQGELEVKKRVVPPGVQPTGRVVAVFETNRPVMIGNLKLKRDTIVEGHPLSPSDQFVIFEPSDARFPHAIAMREELPESFVENPFKSRWSIFSAEYKPFWQKKSKMPLVTNITIVGESGDVNSETDAILMSEGQLRGSFDSTMLDPLYEFLGFSATSQQLSSLDEETPVKTVAAMSAEWKIPEEEVQKRRDLRSYRIFTIDPPTAKDLDDAVHIVPLEDGTFEIGVHIADVSYFLHEDTPLDKEAQQRATSIYMVQKVIPMLPPILCEELCSLNPNVDRLAFSCMWHMKKDGTLVPGSVWYGKSIIRSCAKLDYPTAQNMIDGLIPSEPSPGDDPDAFLRDLPETVWETRRRPVGQSAWGCSRDVRTMNAVAKERRLRRMETGAMVLSSAKLSFHLDADGYPDSMTTYEIRESNQLIEEFMLMANYLVAQKLLTNLEGAAFLRRHMPPNPQKLLELRDMAARVGVILDIENVKQLQNGMLQIAAVGDPVVSTVCATKLMYSMKLAEYVVVAKVADEGFEHFALSIPFYTHFTSPIRRYADVMVHRQLQLSLEQPELALEIQNLPENIEKIFLIAEQCNDRKYAAKKSQEKSDQLFLALYLAHKPRIVDGVVVGLGAKSFSVQVLGPYGDRVERIFIDKVPGVTASFDEVAEELTLTRESSGSRDVVIDNIRSRQRGHQRRERRSNSRKPSSASPSPSREERSRERSRRGRNKAAGRIERFRKKREEKYHASSLVEEGDTYPLQFVGAITLQIFTSVKLLMSVKDAVGGPWQVSVQFLGPADAVQLREDFSSDEESEEESSVDNLPLSELHMSGYASD